MQTIPVSSSLIAGAAYDDEAQSLVITFKSGARWAYGDAGQPFTQSDADAFAAAPSAGSYFLSSIKGSWPERRA